MGKLKMKTEEQAHPADAEFLEYRRMFAHVLEHADDYGVSPGDEAEAEVLAILLMLEKEGEIRRTGERRLASNGRMQDVFVAVHFPRPHPTTH
jgi:hypothetical protein